MSTTGVFVGILSFMILAIIGLGIAYVVLAEEPKKKRKMQVFISKKKHNEPESETESEPESEPESVCAPDSKPCRTYADCDGGRGYCNTCKGGGNCCAKTGGDAGCKNAEKPQPEPQLEAGSVPEPQLEAGSAPEPQLEAGSVPEGFNLMGGTHYFSYV